MKARTEEGEVEVVLLAPEHQCAPPVLGFGGEKSFRERLVPEAGLGDAVVELAEEERLDPRQVLLRHPSNRRPRPCSSVFRQGAVSALLPIGKTHTWEGSIER